MLQRLSWIKQQLQWASIRFSNTENNENEQLARNVLWLSVARSVNIKEKQLGLEFIS